MEITKEEQYDRQIRLWGIEAQRRMQVARVLICGLSGVHVEVCKNLVLSGVNVTILDPKCVTTEDLSSNYFVGQDDIGKNRAAASRDLLQGLNGFVDVFHEDTPLHKLSCEDIALYQAVLVADCSETEALALATTCRSVNVPFFWSSSFGLEGCFFVDLGDQYEYKDDVRKEKHALSFPSLSSALQMKMSLLKSRKLDVSLVYFKFRLFETFRTRNGRLPSSSDTTSVNAIAAELLSTNEMSPGYFDLSSLNVPETWATFLPTCSVLGGILAQEVIKVMTGLGAPINNFFVYSAADFCGRSFLLRY